MAGKPLFDAFIRLRADGSVLAGEVKEETRRALEGAAGGAASAGRRVGDRYSDAVSRAATSRLRATGDDAGKTLAEGTTRGTTTGLRDARGRFTRAGEQAGEAVTDGATRQIEQSRGRFQGALTRSFQGMSGRMRSIGQSLGGWLHNGMLAAGVAAGVGFMAAFKNGISGAANQEQSLIGIDTLLPGGMDVARKFYGQLTKFAATTPFELPGLLENARALLGVGQAAKQVLPDLTALGNASSALGLDQERFDRVILAVTQSMSKGKVQAEELMQITEAGIPIWPILSKALKKPIPEIQNLATKGKLLSKDVFPALFSQMNKDYGGAMERQGKTLSGVWSTVKDTVGLALTDAVQPLVPWLKEYLPKAATAAAKGIAAFGRGIKKLSDYLGPLIEKGKKFGSTFVDKLVPGGFDSAVKRIQQGLADIRKGWDMAAGKTSGPAPGTGNPSLLAAQAQADQQNGLSGGERMGASMEKIVAGAGRAAESAIKVYGRLREIWQGIAERVGPNLGKLISTVANTFSLLTSNTEGSQGTLRALADILQGTLVPVVSFLANTAIKGLTLAFMILNQQIGAIKIVVETVVIPALNFLIKSALAVFDTIIQSAAKAFGWVPGLGPKLQSAAEDFRKFKEKVNTELGGIQDQVVDVSVNLSSNSNYLAAIAHAKEAAQFRLGGTSTKPRKPGKGRASGGAVSADGSYWVGEFGPERFTPGQAGTIQPTERSGFVGGKDLRRLVSLMERLVSAAESGGRGSVVSAIDRALGARLA